MSSANAPHVVGGASWSTPFRKLSVLMPIYNERWTLRDVVSRVLSCNVPLEIEVIAVDDGSTDGSWELLQKLAEQDRRIRPIRHDGNHGKRLRACFLLKVFKAQEERVR